MAREGVTPEAVTPEGVSRSPLSRRWRRIAQLLPVVADHAIAERIRRIMLPLALVYAACFFGYIVNQRYPIADWLFLRYAKSWLLVLYWFGGVMSGCYAIVHRLAPRWPLSERLVMSCATGVYVSYLLMFLGGVLGLYRFAPFAAGLPLLLMVAGGRPLVSALRRALGHWQAVRRRTLHRFSLVSTAIGVPKDKKQLGQFLENAGFLVTGKVCKKLKWPASIQKGFTKAANRGKEELWVRRVTPIPVPIPVPIPAPMPAPSAPGPLPPPFETK